MAAEELKPCPFCGEKVELHHTDHSSSTYWWVRCYCGIDADGQYNNRQGVIDHWNRRPDTKVENLQHTSNKQSTPCDSCDVPSSHCVCRVCTKNVVRI